MDAVWQSMPFVIERNADLEWMEALPDRVAAKLRHIILATNEPLDRSAAVVVSAMRRMPQLRSVAWGPCHGDPLIELDILTYLAGPDAPRLTSFEMTMPDVWGYVYELPASQRRPFWPALAAVLRAQTELERFGWVHVNGAGIPESDVHAVFEALAALPRLQCLDTQDSRGFDLPYPEGLERRSLRRVTWQTSDTLMPLVLGYFSPQRIHLRELGDPDEQIVPEASDVPDLRAIVFDMHTYDTAFGLVADVGVEHLTLTCPWATEFYLAVATTELVATLRDVARSPKLRTFVVQLDSQNPDATLETCHRDARHMIAHGGGVEMVDVRATPGFQGPANRTPREVTPSQPQ